MEKRPLVALTTDFRKQIQEVGSRESVMSQINHDAKVVRLPVSPIFHGQYVFALLLRGFLLRFQLISLEVN